MTKIAKHDTEEEGESDTGEDGRINFFIGGNTICVNDFLEYPGEFIISEQARWLHIMISHLHEVRYFNIAVALFNSLYLTK